MSYRLQKQLMNIQGNMNQWYVWPQEDKIVGQEIHITSWIINIQYLSSQLDQKISSGIPQYYV